MIKIGLLREYKQPEDVRVCLTPAQCQSLMNDFNELEIVVEPYSKRCYANEEYRSLGIPLQEDLSDCDVLFGVKEVPKERLIANKTYFFFSHTIKKQDYNLDLIQKILKAHIRLIDHETLTRENGERVLGFGRWAGIVGAHYAILMACRKLGDTQLKTASECHDLKQMVSQYHGLVLPKMKIALTGSGRVGRGAKEILDLAGVEMVNNDEFLTTSYDHAVYCILDTEDLYQTPEGKAIVPQTFYQNPASAENAFTPYTKVADVLINGIYWDFRAPALFKKEEIQSDEFAIKIISDITCDVEGSVPITLRQTSIEEPYIGIDKYSGEETEAFSQNCIDVMAVGNLPNELPRDASKSFGDAFASQVVPELLSSSSDLLDRATIAQNGQLTRHFAYLQDWVDGKE